MILDLIWALVAAAILAALGMVFKRPRAAVATWSRSVVRRAQLRLYLQHREDVHRAIERIAVELAQRKCDEEGNPDDEYWSDWYRWFTGDQDANVDYGRKQQRDLERLRRGDFRSPLGSGATRRAGSGALNRQSSCGYRRQRRLIMFPESYMRVKTRVIPATTAVTKIHPNITSRNAIHCAAPEGFQTLLCPILTRGIA